MFRWCWYACLQYLSAVINLLQTTEHVYISKSDETLIIHSIYSVVFALARLTSAKECLNVFFLILKLAHG